MWQKVVLLTIFLFISFEFSRGGDTAIITDDDSEDSPLSHNCMRCLCKVMGCLRDEGCANNVCGLFHITRGYWETAHYRSNDPANKQEYEQCTTNAWCASRTVQRYMRQNLPACELKRTDRLRCENAVALHKFGSRRCHQNLTSTLKTKLFKCLEKYVLEWLVDDDGVL